jgi:hypothetical protein
MVPPGELAVFTHEAQSARNHVSSRRPAILWQHEDENRAARPAVTTLACSGRFLREVPAVICACNLGKFGGDAVVDIMRTHPMVIIGGIQQQNPFFVPPAEVLREARALRAGRTVPTTTAA